MGAFKEIATKLQLNGGRVDGKNGLKDEEIEFLWVFARKDYYKLTGRKTGPRGEKKEEVKEPEPIQGVFSF